jgi:hypothetical protein
MAEEFLAVVIGWCGVGWSKVGCGVCISMCVGGNVDGCRCVLQVFCAAGLLYFCGFDAPVACVA